MVAIAAKFFNANRDIDVIAPETVGKDVFGHGSAFIGYDIEFDRQGRPAAIILKLE